MNNQLIDALGAILLLSMIIFGGYLEYKACIKKNITLEKAKKKDSVG